MGDHERAAHYYRRAIALDTARFFGYVNLGESLVMLGRFEPARDTFAQAVRLAPASAWALVNEALVDYPAGNYEQAEKKLRALFDDDDANTAVRQRAGSRLFLLLGARGRFAESQRLRRSLAEARGGPDEADQQVLRTQFFYELFVLKDKERARSTLQRVRSSFDAAAETDSSALHSMAEACAWLGDLACARDYLKRTGFAGEPQPWTTTDTYFALGAIALAEGNVEAAVRYFRGGSDTNCPSCEEAVVGHVFEQVGQPDSALAAYERYLATPSMDRVWADAFGLGSALYSVAQLHEARGDRKRAASAYADLLRLWQDADPELQPIVQDARNRLARLQPDG
jgi:tetratricopeptide (TPR) repeat protein